VNHGICRAFRFNRRHVACDASVSRTAILVVRVFLNRRGSWAVRRGSSVTVKAEFVSRLA
jgi:hypothetical protein